MVMKAKVEGAAAKIDAIQKFDKKAWREIQKGVKLATSAITKNAEGRVPPMGLVPTSGGKGWGPWFQGNRDLSFVGSEFKFGTRFRSRNKQGFRQVYGYSVLNVSSPAVAIFTLAGSKNQSGHPFNRNINRQTGTRQGARNVQMWPRMLTPAYYEEGPEAAKTIGRIIEDAVRDVNSA